MTIDYLAGFFDGEGSIGVYRCKGSKDPRYKSGYKSPSWIRSVTVVNTYRPMLEAFKRQFGGVISFMDCPGRTKACFQWQLHSKDEILNCLESLTPHLYEKKRQAQLMMYECLGMGKTSSIAKHLKELKHEIA